MIDYNDKKIFIEKDLWYIENFLTEEELDILINFANEESGWYKTMRSPSIRNKFLGIKVKEVDENGFLKRIPVVGIDEGFDFPVADGDSDLHKRLISVLPPTMPGISAYQSFWPLNDEENKKLNDLSDNNGMGAYKYHYEAHPDLPGQMTAAWSLYLNDNFEGGILKFKNKPYQITAKPGMLINIPITEEFEHKVTPVTSGIRHTLYGSCHESGEERPVSTVENC
jgi:hypothetical protein